MPRVESPRLIVQKERRRTALRIHGEMVKRNLLTKEISEEGKRDRLTKIPGTRRNFLAENNLPDNYGLHPRDENKRR